MKIRVLIPHSRPTLGREEVSAVKEVIKSGYLSQGKKVKELEESLAGFIGVSGGAAVNSGTSALHLTLLALGVKKGDEVILPDYVCSAVLNAVVYTGATPVLVDINPENFTLEPSEVKKKISKKTKAIVVVHLFGSPADLSGLADVKVPVIEDCAQAIGAVYQGKRVGGFGRASIFSFYATKVITGGEGGMVLSDDRNLLERIRELREYDEKPVRQVSYNYKLTDLQAAIILAQFKKLPAFIARRQEIGKRYNQSFAGYNLKIPKGSGHIFFRYVLLIPPAKNLGKVMSQFKKKGIVCRRPVYKSLHHYFCRGLIYQARPVEGNNRLYGARGSDKSDPYVKLELPGFPVTEQVYNSALSLPLYPSLSEAEVNRIISTGVALFS